VRISFSPLNFCYVGKDDEYRVRTDKPEAAEASKLNAHVDHNENMGDIDPEYRNEVDKALGKMQALIKYQMR
jgi:hypothetical protein